MITKYIGNFKYTYKDVEVDWSENAVEFTIYDEKGRHITHGECEEHMLETYVKNEIEKMLKHKYEL